MLDPEQSEGLNHSTDAATVPPNAVHAQSLTHQGMIDITRHIR